MLLRSIAFLLATVSLVSCAATGPQFERLEAANQNEVVVYVYRPNSFVAGGSYPTLSIDGKEDVGLKNGGYVRRAVGVGRHTIALQKTFNWSEPLSVKLSTERGRTYFLKLEIQHSGSIQANAAGPGSLITHKFYYYFREVTEAEGLADLKATKRLE